MAKVAIVKRESIGAAIRAALDPFHMEPMIAGRIVAIKPNDTWASREDTTAVR